MIDGRGWARGTTPTHHTGLYSTSDPRMLSSHATSSRADTTNMAAPSAASALRTCVCGGGGGGGGVADQVQGWANVARHGDASAQCPTRSPPCALCFTTRRNHDASTHLGDFVLQGGPCPLNGVHNGRVAGERGSVCPNLSRGRGGGRRRTHAHARPLVRHAEARSRNMQCACLAWRQGHSAPRPQGCSQAPAPAPQPSTPAPWS